MIEFALACAVFLASHVVPAASGLKGALVGRWGRRAYMVLYSLLSLGLLAWLISAAARAPYVPLWGPAPGLMHLPFLLMPVSCVLIVAGGARANPVSVSFVGGDADPARPGLPGVVRHPVLWGFALWALGHLAANGDLVSVLMFGSFAVFAFAGMAGLGARARRQGRRPVAEGPPGRRLRLALDGRLAVEVAGGLALFLALLALHGPVIGVDPTVWL